jgi:UDP-glucose 4-epimerase
MISSRKGHRMTGRYLVTGGAGFVGSHIVAALLDRGDDVVVFDHLSTGHREAVLPGARLIIGDLDDERLVDYVVADGPWDGVFHFAALSIVGDSMRDPFRYIAENVGTGVRLIAACVRHKVPKFVLSSTAALFGSSRSTAIDETANYDPDSPYGESKAMLERALHWADRVHGLRSACLRYFNAAGADPAGRLGEDHTPESHLIPLVIDAALGRRAEIAVFGDDYPTPDGTCVRDYVHVADLADAHLRVLAPLSTNSVRYNLGTGHGHSVLEVIQAVERVSGRRVPMRRAARRAGDPAVLIAGADRIRRDLGWQPRYADLDTIAATALQWRQSHPDGYRTGIRRLAHGNIAELFHAVTD